MDLQSIIINNSLNNLLNEFQNGFTKPLMKEKNEDSAIKFLLEERKKHLSNLDQLKKHNVSPR